MSEPIVFDIPMRVPFRGLSRRSGVLFEGACGWAEWSPFPEYDDHEAAQWLKAALDFAEHSVPAPLRDTVDVNGIVPALDPADAARRAVESGCSTIKIKVAAKGQSLDDDIARVAAVRSALPHAKLRVDANAGWSRSEARTAINELEGFHLEYVEQPCAEVVDLAWLRAQDLTVAIAADESIRRAEDPMRVKRAGAADVAILKVQPLGGISRCLRLAEELDLPVVVSSAVETSVGLAAGVAFAAALPGQELACGLETQRLLGADVTGQPLIPTAGKLRVGRVDVDRELLAAVRPDSSTEAFWIDRWRRVTELLGERP